MNYLDTKKQLLRYILARIPFISFTTIEKQRAIEMLFEISSETNLPFYIHSMSKGIHNLTTNEVLSDEKTLSAALDYIADALKTKENQTFILSGVSELSEDSFTSRYLADIISTADKRSSSVIVVGADKIWPALQRLGMNVDMDLPDEIELLQIIKETITPYKDQLTIEWTENDYKDVANILLGISKIETRNVISSLIAKGSLVKEDLIDLKFAKDGLFSDISGLEKIKVDEQLAYGGLENLKTWLEDKQKLMDPVQREEMKRRGMKSPRGILLMGVPGCGKSLSAKAIASRWKLPLYLLDFSTIQGRYVGQSEQQLKEALSTAEHVSPCILWIDEIEKGLAGAGDSSGVTNRLIGQFLFWLQENEKDVFVIATANNVNTLPPELLRKGRFDEMFFIDLPNEEERFEIINLYLQKYLNAKVGEAVTKRLVGLSAKFSGADIEAAIREVAYKTLSSEVTLTVELLSTTFEQVVPSYDTNRERIETIRTWAKGRTIPATKNNVARSEIETL